MWGRGFAASQFCNCGTQRFFRRFSQRSLKSVSPMPDLLKSIKEVRKVRLRQLLIRDLSNWCPHSTSS